MTHLTQVTPPEMWESVQAHEGHILDEEQHTADFDEHPVALVMPTLTDSFIWYWIFSSWHDSVVSRGTSLNPK